MAARWVVLIGLCGCDQVLGLSRPTDASIDSPPDIVDPTLAIGCADGIRDAFDDLDDYPMIAGCSGGWTVAGLDADGRVGTATALCAIDWHICADAVEVAGAGANCSALVAPGEFYATNQPSNGNLICGGNGFNDIFGCGRMLGDALPSCTPLDRHLRIEGTGPLASWNLGTDPSLERHSVLKAGTGGGGVLCCRDHAMLREPAAAAP